MRESLELRRRALPAGHWQIASSESCPRGCLTAAGRYREAEGLLLRAHAALAEALGETHERTLDARKRLVALYEAWGRPSKADRFRARAAAAATP